MIEVPAVLTVAAPEATATPAAVPTPDSNAASVFYAHRWRVVATYVLFNMENLVRLAQPWVLGWAVNDLLSGRATGLTLCVAQYLLGMVLCGVRHLYDTRTFTCLYADLATRLVVEQRQSGVDLSRVAARSSLAREVVDFFERDLPFLFHTVYSAVGALVMIALVDAVPLALSLLVLVLTGLLMRSLARQTLHLNRGLNDQIEQEVTILQQEAPERVAEHYQQLRDWHIRLCNVQVFGLGVSEALALLLLVFVLVRGCGSGTLDAGTLFVLVGYVTMLTNSLVNLPQWIQQMSRLRDIRRRLFREELALPPAPAPGN